MAGRSYYHLILPPVDKCFQLHTFGGASSCEKGELFFMCIGKNTHTYSSGRPFKSETFASTFSHSIGEIRFDEIHICAVHISQNAHVGSLKIVINIFFSHFFFVFAVPCVCWTWQNVIIQLCNLITVSGSFSIGKVSPSFAERKKWKLLAWEIALFTFLPLKIFPQLHQKFSL